MIALVLATSAPSPSGWLGVVLAAIGVIGTLITYLSNRSKNEADETRSETEETKALADLRKVEVRESSKRFATEHGLAARLLDEERAHLQAVEADRDRAVSENVVLHGENATLSLKIVEYGDRIDTLESEARESKFEVVGLKNEVRDCHAQRDLDREWMRQSIQWMREEFVAKNPRGASESPRPRSVTPGDMPAVTTEKS